MKNYYIVLGVSQDASLDDITRSYRKLVFQYHPDKNPDDKDCLLKFKEVQEAYEYLVNKKNKSYFDFSSKNSVDDIFNNIFYKYFENQNLNNSCKIRVKISLEESYNGCIKQVNIDDHFFCKSCEGTGGASWVFCEKCSGKGFVYDKNEKITIQTTCYFCQGKGSNIKDKCNSCKGQGFIVSGTRNFSIEVPSGIKDGTQIKIENQGSNRTNLFIVVNIDKHNFYKRDNQNLVCDLEVPYSVLLFGGKIDFSLFGNILPITVKARTNPGSKIVIKNQGFSFMENKNTKGDLIFNIKLKFPNMVTKEYKEHITNSSKYEL